MMLVIVSIILSTRDLVQVLRSSGVRWIERGHLESDKTDFAIQRRVHPPAAPHGWPARRHSALVLPLF